MTPRPITKRVAVVTAGALVVVGTFAAGVGVAGSGKQSEKPTKAEIAAQFDGWNKALRTGDPGTVADRYGKDAVLLPTVSDKVRSNQAGIVGYFEKFLENKPVGKKLETHINILDHDSAVDAGVYEFTLTDPDSGDQRVVKARYSYTYEKYDGEWKIVNHHSSVMPEG